MITYLFKGQWFEKLFNPKKCTIDRSVEGFAIVDHACQVTIAVCADKAPLEDWLKKQIAKV